MFILFYLCICALPPCMKEWGRNSGSQEEGNEMPALRATDLGVGKGPGLSSSRGLGA